MSPDDTLMVTGGAGFIGSALVRLILTQTPARVVNVDKLTYAGNPESLADVANDPRYAFVCADVADAAAMEAAFARYRPTGVLHLAAESHVDRSIHAADAFVQSNVVGTSTLLEAARRHWQGLDADARAGFRFVHVSTDEVFGSLGPNDPPFHDDSPRRPNSPYAATKAASDHLVRAWHRTYGLPAITTQCSNNYGPRQFPEKLIPLMILNALAGNPLPVYGDGGNVRDWLYVEDHCQALLRVLAGGTPGESYLIGGGREASNLSIVRTVCRLLDARRPAPEGAYERLIGFVADRPGHDWRYAVDSGKIRRELGWTPRETFESGLARTVDWYLDNPAWVDRVRSGAYRDWIAQNYGAREGGGA